MRVRIRASVVALTMLAVLLWAGSASAAARKSTVVGGIRSSYSSTGVRAAGALLYRYGSAAGGVSGRTLYLYRSGVLKANAKSNSSGSFTFLVTPGDYTVRFKGDTKYRPSSFSFKVKSPSFPDPRNTVYAVDSSNHRVQLFDRQGIYLGQFGGHGSAPGKMKYPYSIARDAFGNLYVTDSLNYRVQKFDSDGTYITSWGGYGHTVGLFDKPEGVAVDTTSGAVFVVDMNNQRVQRFTLNGKFVKEWGSWGTGPGQFNYPSQIAIDASGTVYVVDSGNDRVQKFDQQGRYLGQWGSRGSNDGQFGHGIYGGGWGIATSPQGVVYVVDYGNYRVQAFDRDGSFLFKWGATGSGNGQFQRACQVSLDASGTVYVSDVVNCRVQRFDAQGDYLGQWGSSGQGNGQFGYSPQGLVALRVRE